MILTVTGSEDGRPNHLVPANERGQEYQLAH